MSRNLSAADRQDIRWAHNMVSKGVKPVSILNTDLRCAEHEVEGILAAIMAHMEDNRVTACYLDMVRDPGKSGKEFTGGALLRPVIGALPTGSGSYAVFFAATETMADLFRWAFLRIRDEDGNECQRAHAIVGLLCGYDPLAIEAFLEQPSKPVVPAAPLDCAG